MQCIGNWDCSTEEALKCTDQDHCFFIGLTVPPQQQTGCIIIAHEFEEELGDCETCPVRHKCGLFGMIDPCCFGQWDHRTCPDSDDSERSKCRVIEECQTVTGATNGAIAIKYEIDVPRMSNKVRACYGEWARNNCPSHCKDEEDCRQAWIDNREEYTAILVVCETDCPGGWKHWSHECTTCEFRDPCLVRRVMGRVPA